MMRLASYSTKLKPYIQKTNHDKAMFVGADLVLSKTHQPDIARALSLLSHLLSLWQAGDFVAWC